MQTVWSPAEKFLEQYDANEPEAETSGEGTNSGQAASLKLIMQHYTRSQ
jgi:hypothetical protein